MTKIGRMIYEDGIEEGMEKGIKKGIKKEKVQTAERLLKKNIDLDIVMEVTDLTREEIEAIQQKLLAVDRSTIS